MNSSPIYFMCFFIVSNVATLFLICIAEGPASLVSGPGLLFIGGYSATIGLCLYVVLLVNKKISVQGVFLNAVFPFLILVWGLLVTVINMGMWSLLIRSMFSPDTDACGQYLM